MKYLTITSLLGVAALMAAAKQHNHDYDHIAYVATHNALWHERQLNLMQREQMPPRLARWYDLADAAVDKACRKKKKCYINTPLVLAVMWQESRGNPDAISRAGAIGLMQLMPKTAASLGVNPHDPAENINGGAAYLQSRLELTGGDIDKALAAYNCGYGCVTRRWPDLPAETIAYMPAVKGHYAAFNETPEGF